MSRLTDSQLRQLAEATLDGNWRRDHSVPSRTLYPHQWSWDTAFTAVGMARYAPDRAWADLRALFAAQWGDGRVPHIVFDEDTGAAGERHYFPGPRFWQTTNGQHPTSGIVQPPVHALAAWEVHRHAPDLAALRWLYPRLVAQQHYLMACRTIGGAGLAAIVHPWESGQDNSPAWDQSLAAVPVDPELTRGRRDLAVSHASHRPTDEDYARYVFIAQCYRSYDYVDDGPGERYPFLVECPAFNAILAAAEHALADIAALVGADPQPHQAHASRLTQALSARLFDPATGMFHARDLYTGQLSRAHCIGGLIPLILPELPASQVESLLATAASPRFGLAKDMELPLPSYDWTAPDLDPERYWRGPVWINMNWLLWRGLHQHGQPDQAEALRHAMLDLVRRSGCYEYFHPVTGAGIGSPSFSWTAALTLDLLAPTLPPALA